MGADWVVGYPDGSPRGAGDSLYWGPQGRDAVLIIDDVREVLRRRGLDELGARVHVGEGGYNPTVNTLPGMLTRDEFRSIYNVLIELRREYENSLAGKPISFPPFSNPHVGAKILESLCFLIQEFEQDERLTRP